jgi:hypothetical protein
MNTQLKNRILQFIWAGIGMGIAYGLDYMATNIGLFNLSNDVVVLIGLIVPVITKAIRNYVVANYQLP